MNAYACTECDWEYVWTMGNRAKAVKRHQLTHLLERHGWLNDVDGVVNRLRAEQASMGEMRSAQHHGD